MSSNFRLPQELVDHTIDNLYNDTRSLKSCSLVCRSWLPTSRVHLFSRVAFKARSTHSLIHQPRELCSQLYKLLLANPDLARYIRSLEVWEGAPGANPARCDMRYVAWVMNEPTLPLLLSRLTSLKRLEFSGNSLIPYQSLPDSLQRAFHNTLAQPSFSYLRLHNWVFPTFGDLATMLTRIINLKGLALSSVYVADQTGGDDIFDGVEDTRLDGGAPDVDTSDVDRGLVPVEADPRVTINSTSPISACASSSSSTVSAYSPTSSTSSNPYSYAYSYENGLEFLTLDFVEFKNISTWLLNPRCPLNIQGLRELRIAHSQDVAVTSRLLTSIGGSLEHLHLKPGPWDVHTFDLSLNPCLRSLRLTLEDASLAIPWILTLLSSLTPSNNTALTHISLEVYADLKKMPIDGWADIASMLTRTCGGLNALESLQHMDIGVFAHPNSVEFGKVRKEMDVVEKLTMDERRERISAVYPFGTTDELELVFADAVRGIQVKVYQLGLKSRKSCVDLAPRISWFQG